MPPRIFFVVVILNYDFDHNPIMGTQNFLIVHACDMTKTSFSISLPSLNLTFFFYAIYNPNSIP